MPTPISLSDDQLCSVMQATEVLEPSARSGFLVALADLLKHEPQPLGDGALHRAIRDLQPKFHQPLGISNAAVRPGRPSKLKADAPIA